MQTATDSPEPPLLDLGPPGKMFPQQQTRQKKEKESVIYMCVCVFGGRKGRGGMSRFTEHTFTADFFPFSSQSIRLSKARAGRGVYTNTYRNTKHTQI